MPVPDTNCIPDRQPASLQVDIKIVGDMMIKVHYYEEANWLWMASASRSSCASRRAQEVLLDAAPIARQFGFPAVAKWIERDVLQGSER
jgi:hypothetical protein